MSNAMFVLQFVTKQTERKNVYLDLFRSQEVPVSFQRSRLHLLIVDEDFVGVIGLHDQGVEMGVDVIFATDVLVDQQILSLVAEDDVHLLGAGPADVRAEHDLIGGLAVHVLLLQLAVKHLHVSATAVNVLLVLHGELHHQGLAGIGESIELSGESVETRIFRSLQT